MQLELLRVLTMVVIHEDPEVQRQSAQTPQLEAKAAQAQAKLETAGTSFFRNSFCCRAVASCVLYRSSVEMCET
jgi:hypothetical protein